MTVATMKTVERVVTGDSGDNETVERVVTGDSGDNEDSGESSDW